MSKRQLFSIGSFSRKLAFSSSSFRHILPIWRLHNLPHEESTYILRRSYSALFITPQWHRSSFCYSTADNRNISLEDLQKLVTEADQDLFYLIDVREPAELIEDGKIPGASNLPLGEVSDALKLTPATFKERYGFSQPTADDNVILYCRAGVRSLKALKAAQEQGFSRWRHYPGGWLGWAEAHK